MKFVGKTYEPNNLHPENLSQSYQGGLIVNSTRTPKDFKFDKSDVYGLAISYDQFKKQRSMELKNLGIDSTITLEDYMAAVVDEGILKVDSKTGTGKIQSAFLSRRKDWIKSKYFGSISSAIYNGSFNLGEVVQDFNLKYSEGSWVEKQKFTGKSKNYKQFDIFTVSSHAASFLYGKMSKYENLWKHKKVLSISYDV